MPQQPPRSGRPEYRKAGLQKTTASLCKEAGAQGNNRSKEMLQSPPPPPRRISDLLSFRASEHQEDRRQPSHNSTHPHPDPDPAGLLLQANQPTTAAPAHASQSFLRQIQSRPSWGAAPVAVSAAPLAAFLVFAPPALARPCTIYYNGPGEGIDYYFSGTTQGHLEKSPFPHPKEPAGPCKPAPQLTFSW